MSRVVLVEDDPVSAKLVVRVLQNAGHEVDHANNGLEAVELLAAGDYDVLVTDMMMARMDGRELCEWVRNDLALDDLPIVMTTGRSDLESEPWIEDMGVTLMIKPIKLQALIARLAAL